MPKIASLKPVVLPDKRRVTLQLVVTGLPGRAADNITLMMPQSSPEEGDFESRYPHVELSILNSRRQQVASLFIVEYKEPETALTLHLPEPDRQEQYTARAEMTYQDEIMEVVEVPFALEGAN